MSLSASSGLFLANRSGNCAPKMTTGKNDAAIVKNDFLYKKQEPQKVNPFNVSQDELSSQIAASNAAHESVSTETLGTMAYNGGGAEAAGTMASAGSSSSSSVSCVA